VFSNTADVDDKGQTLICEADRPPHPAGLCTNAIDQSRPHHGGVHAKVTLLSGYIRGYVYQVTIGQSQRDSGFFGVVIGHGRLCSVRGVGAAFASDSRAARPVAVRVARACHRRRRGRRRARWIARARTRPIAVGATTPRRHRRGGCPRTR